MNIKAAFELGGSEFEEASRQVKRFERSRFFVAIGLISLIGIASLLRKHSSL